MTVLYLKVIVVGSGLLRNYSGVRLFKNIFSLTLLFLGCPKTVLFFPIQVRSEALL